MFAFYYDLFLNQESNPPVNHLHHEKLMFSSKKHKFHHKLIKTGGVMVVHEDSKMMPRTGADYSIMSTFLSSSVLDHEKIKSYPAMKERNKDRGSRVGKHHKHHKPRQEHIEENSKSNITSREHEGGKSILEWSSSSSSLRISTKTQVEAKVDFKVPKITTRESESGGGGQLELRAVPKRPSSTTESYLSTKKLQSLKGCKERGPFTGVPPPPTCLEKKRASEKKSHWEKKRQEAPVVKRRTDSDSEDETLFRSVSFQSTSSRSCLSSSCDPEFEPIPMQSQGRLSSMVERVCIDNSDEVKTTMKDVPMIQDSCLFMDSDSYDYEKSHPHNQEQKPPKLRTNNHKMLVKKNPDSSQRKTVFQGSKAYTEELVDLHRRLMALRERNTLQEIVNLIEKTGLYNITKTTFDFDLLSLDEPTVRKLQSYLQAKRP